MVHLCLEGCEPAHELGDTETPSRAKDVYPQAITHWQHKKKEDRVSPPAFFALA